MFTQLLGNIPYGRFGHALAAMGDLNFDSYEGEGDMLLMAVGHAVR